MKRHVDLLGTLYLIWGALNLVVSLAMLALSFASLAIAGSAASGEPGARIAASFLAGLFLTLSVLGLLWGAVHLWCAFALQRGRDWARPIGIVLGILDLVVLPFGTALGAYGLWVLTHRDVRAAFAAERT
ncbi:MAG: hypothetical protein IMZ67_05030 [Acidobacteria bacterium]|nr:hypothetical protein [Acidobacteriota bacterium]